MGMSPADPPPSGCSFGDETRAGRQAFASSLSVMASGWVPCFTVTDVMPSTLRR